MAHHPAADIVDDYLLAAIYLREKDVTISITLKKTLKTKRQAPARKPTNEPKEIIETGR